MDWPRSSLSSRSSTILRMGLQDSRLAASKISHSAIEMRIPAVLSLPIAPDYHGLIASVQSLWAGLEPRRVPHRRGFLRQLPPNALWYRTGPPLGVEHLLRPTRLQG